VGCKEEHGFACGRAVVVICESDDKAEEGTGVLSVLNEKERECDCYCALAGWIAY
jgi:hypothetical protein